MNFWLFPVLLLLVFPAILLTRTLLLEKKQSSYAFESCPEREQMLAEKLSQMVQVETISEKGVDQPEKMRKMHTVMEALFPAVFANLEKIDIDGNLLMKWKGKSSNCPVMLMSHIDVVAPGEDWSKEPFGGEISDGKVWGRGTADTKGSVMAFYQAAEELLQEGFVPEVDIYLCSSCTEEIGGDGADKIVRWLKENEVHLSMVCDEGGGIISDPIAGVPGQFAMIGVYEKGQGNVVFTAHSHGGHAAAPEKNSPLVRLGAFMNDVEKHYPMRSEFSPEVTAMFSTLAPYARGPLRIVLANLWCFKPLLKRVLPSISGQAAAMLCTTIAFTRASGSDGYNVIPSSAWVSANLRFIPHQKAEESIQILKKKAEEYHLETEVLEAWDPTPSADINSYCFQQIEEIIQTTFPTLQPVPYVVTGGTDCRFYTDAADVCIRFAPLVYGPEQMKGMHGRDENIETSCLPGAVAYYKNVICAQNMRPKPAGKA